MLVSRVNWTSRLTSRLLELGPYTALVLALPGGTLIVASLWAFRHRRWLLAQARALIIVLALGGSVTLQSHFSPAMLLLQQER